jgi:predicted Zn-dependent protease
VLQLLAAEVLLAGGDADRALTRLDTDAAAAERAQRAPRLLRAQATLARFRARAGEDGGALREATESLQTWTAEHPDDALAWTLLAQCAEAVGLPLRAARAAAEARAARGDLPGAIDLLRATQRRSQPGSSPDFIEFQVIDSRVRAWIAQVRQERLDRGLPPVSDRLSGRGE